MRSRLLGAVAWACPAASSPRTASMPRSTLQYWEKQLLQNSLRRQPSCPSLAAPLQRSCPHQAAQQRQQRLLALAGLQLVCSLRQASAELLHQDRPARPLQGCHLQSAQDGPSLGSLQQEGRGC